MALNIKKIDSVSIRVRDLDKATKFYTETLGLPEIFRMDEMNLRGYGVGDNGASINIEPGKASMQLIIQVERVDDARKGARGEVREVRRADADDPEHREGRRLQGSRRQRDPAHGLHHRARPGLAPGRRQACGVGGRGGARSSSGAKTYR